MRKEQALAGATLDNRDRLYWSDEEEKAGNDDPAAGLQVAMYYEKPESGEVSAKDIERRGMRIKREQKIRERVDLLNFQILKFKRRVVRHFNVVSAQDALTSIRHNGDEKFWQNWKDEQAAIIERRAYELAESNPKIRFPGGTSSPGNATPPSPTK